MERVNKKITTEQFEMIDQGFDPVTEVRVSWISNVAIRKMFEEEAFWDCDKVTGERLIHRRHLNKLIERNDDMETKERRSGFIIDRILTQVGKNWSNNGSLGKRYMIPEGRGWGRYFSEQEFAFIVDRIAETIEKESRKYKMVTDPDKIIAPSESFRILVKKDTPTTVSTNGFRVRADLSMDFITTAYLPDLEKSNAVAEFVRLQYDWNSYLLGSYQDSYRDQIIADATAHVTERIQEGEPILRSKADMNSFVRDVIRRKIGEYQNEIVRKGG